MWRTPLGIGVVFPLVLFVLRLKLKEPEEFSRESMKNTKTPYWLVLRYYGFRLFVISAVWFLYDVSSSKRFTIVYGTLVWLTATVTVLFLLVQSLFEHHRGQHIWR